MKVLNLKQIRAAEENAVSSGIFSYPALMKNAGCAAAKIICENYPVQNRRVAIVCGVGNNGGDGLVIASRLSEEGADVTVCLPLGDVRTDTAKQMYPISPDIKVSDTVCTDCDIMIDALFGIGLDRPLEDSAAAAVDDMNMCDAVKIAVDVPSGVMCDGGVAGRALRADMTVTFIALKPCHLLPETSQYCGRVSVADIGAVPTEYEYLTTEEPKKQPRPKNCHKGTFGTALIICGSYGMCGAEILATRAALRSGVGIAKNVVCDKNYTAFCTSVPEAVTVPVPTSAGGVPVIDDGVLSRAIKSSDALLIGCGLSNCEDTVRLVKRVLAATDIPVVIDADGINALRGDINIIGKTKSPVIITPHPAEMARLCGVDTADIENDRVGFARKLAVKACCVVVLKGANTVIASPDGRIFFNATGNPALATGGSGDVLAGMLVAHLAQGKSALRAALDCVWLHGHAADTAVKRINESALLPSDIIEELKTL